MDEKALDVAVFDEVVHIWDILVMENLQTRAVYNRKVWSEVFLLKLFYNHKESITPEQFNSYWANNHTALITPFRLRLGVVKYSQYHSTPELCDLVREGGIPVLEFDGAAEFWMHDLATLQKMQRDPFYVEKIRPDEEKFIVGTSLKLVVGVDYIVVDNQNAVMEHGRTF